MQFSERTAWNTEETELARAWRERKKAGLPIADLTASNPTRCGFIYPENWLESLKNPLAFDYDPDPRGMLQSREAVCRYYVDHGADIEPSNVILTTGTSEAYGYLFKLLCNPGDEVLVPQPSYPLFDFLAEGEVVRLASAPLVYDHGWQIDIEGLRRGITDRTRAIVLVHPNNPTGHFTSPEQTLALAEVCRERGIALIIDEVFLDYVFTDKTLSVFSENQAQPTTFAGRDLGVPVFVVSGISKICGLPQMKAAWIAATGPKSGEALERLEVLADNYLSMNAPVQLALPVWLAERESMQGQIRARVQGNLAGLDRLLLEQPSGETLVNRLRIEGGWYAVLRIPATRSDEQTARELLDAGVWVHPGHFFGMGRSGWLVVSLLAPEEEFFRGMEALMAYMQGNQED